MKFYIVDDDKSVVRVIENIIEDQNLGQVIGMNTSSEESVFEIIEKKPDIVIIDLLMPQKDGIWVVEEVKARMSDARFIMISQVSSKELIAKAYDQGIEFFIHKPINVMEVVKVIENLKEKIEMQKTLINIKSMFSNIDMKSEIQTSNDTKNEMIKRTLAKLGVSGEMGSEDIVKMCTYLMKNKKRVSEFKISELCSILNANPRAMEQRVRRTINKALLNIASLGIEDYMNDEFVRYSNKLFNFEDVRQEMDYIRGKKTSGGKINVKKFIDGMMIEVEV